MSSYYDFAKNLLNFIVQEVFGTQNNNPQNPEDV